MIPAEAEDSASAEKIARAMYDRREIVLAAEDTRGTEITAEQEGVCPLCGPCLPYG